MSKTQKKFAFCDELLSEKKLVPRVGFEPTPVGLESTALSVELTEHSGETYVGLNSMLIMAIHITEIWKNVKRQFWSFAVPWARSHR